MISLEEMMNISNSNQLYEFQISNAMNDLETQTNAKITSAFGSVIVQFHELYKALVNAAIKSSEDIELGMKNDVAKIKKMIELSKTRNVGATRSVSATYSSSQQMQSNEKVSKQNRDDNVMEVDHVLTQKRNKINVIDQCKNDVSDYNVFGLNKSIYGSKVINENRYLNLEAESKKSAPCCDNSFTGIKSYKKAEKKSRPNSEFIGNRTMRTIRTTKPSLPKATCQKKNTANGKLPIIKYARSLSHVYNTRGKKRSNDEKMHLNYQCLECKYVAKNESDMIQHYQFVHSSIDKYECNQCGLCFADNTACKEHSLRIHGIQLAAFERGNKKGLESTKICRLPGQKECHCGESNNGSIMIHCELCKHWVHASCVKIDKFEKSNGVWRCPRCKKMQSTNAKNVE